VQEREESYRHGRADELGAPDFQIAVDVDAKSLRKHLNPIFSLLFGASGYLKAFWRTHLVGVDIPLFVIYYIP
jgi:hypothetical protein